MCIFNDLYFFLHVPLIDFLSLQGKKNIHQQLFNKANKHLRPNPDMKSNRSIHLESCSKECLRKYLQDMLFPAYLPLVDNFNAKINTMSKGYEVPATTQETVWYKLTLCKATVSSSDIASIRPVIHL